MSTTKFVGIIQSHTHSSVESSAHNEINTKPGLRKSKGETGMKASIVVVIF